MRPIASSKCVCLFHCRGVHETGWPSLCLSAVRHKKWTCLRGVSYNGDAGASSMPPCSEEDKPGFVGQGVSRPRRPCKATARTGAVLFLHNQCDSSHTQGGACSVPIHGFFWKGRSAHHHPLKKKNPGFVKGVIGNGTRKKLFLGSVNPDNNVLYQFCLMCTDGN